jgi:hypothetical protein
VREDQVGLKLREPVIRNARVGEQAETGVDAIYGLAAGDDALDRCRGLTDALHGGIIEPRLRAEPKLAQVV